MIKIRRDVEHSQAYGTWLFILTDKLAVFGPEEEWSMSQIQEDAVATGCSRCGDEDADAVYGICAGCG